jgi:monoamine oxidase
MKTPLGRTFQRSLALLRQTHHTMRLNGTPFDEALDSAVETKRQQAYQCSRRRMLQLVGQSSIALLSAPFALSALPAMLSACEQTVSRVNSQCSVPRIAIIGGGLAGLSAAYTLYKAGVRSTVYEASKRLGGRVLTGRGIVGEGILTELGGEFVNSSHRALQTLLREFQMELLDTEQTSEAALSDAFWFGGQMRSEREVSHALDRVVTQSTADAQHLVRSRQQPSASAVLSRIDGMSAAEYLVSQGASGWAQQYLHAMLLSEFGAEPSEMSAINVLAAIAGEIATAAERGYDGEDDERYKIKAGGSELLRRMAELLQATAPDSILYERRLIRLAAQGASYTLTFEAANSSVSEVQADVVICAVPFSVLRTVEMQLPLPTQQRRAIQELGYGTNAKCIVGVNRPVWRSGGYSGNVYSDTLLQGGWDSSLLQGSPTAAFTVFLGGREGATLGSNTAAANATRYLQPLNTIFRGTQAAFTGKAQQMVWAEEPLARGSYACFRVGQATAFAEHLAKPVGNLFFAGEHCSTYFQGYMNGAAETGIKAAQSIIATLNKR